MPLLAAPAGAPAAGEVLGRARGENFPVASRVLGREQRADLIAIYGFARLVDELGDSFAGDRLAALDWLEAELERAFEGNARHPLLVALQPTLVRRGLPREPFLRLIEANRFDQRVARYETWQELRGYCSLSADPVGELVLGVFGAADPGRIELSNSICTALQLTEHCQDVAEDYARGRIYLPGEDLERFGCREADLAGGRASEGVRALIAFELDRARGLLSAGAPLLGELPVRPALAVAAFIAGGRAALDAIEAAHCDVLAGAPRPGRLMLARALLQTLSGRIRGGHGASAASPVARAYAHCEALTRARAANFYWGIRLLAPERRRALSAAYAFARQVDDIGDGALPAEDKLRLLDRAESALAAIERGGDGAGTGTGTGGREDPVLVALADAYGRFRIPPDAFRELIEGVRMDVLGVRYETFEELVRYCRRVAGAIGRVCLAIFAVRAGVGEAASAEALADDLGVALQLTNILRDVREDAEHGRVYLPAEDLRRFGLVEEPSPQDAPGRLAALAHAGARGGAANGRAAEVQRLEELVGFEARRAERWFARGMQLVPLLDRRSAACVVAMAGIYRRLLERIERDPGQVLRRRVSLPAHEKAWVAARGLLGRGR